MAHIELALQPAKRAGECGPGWSASCETLGKPLELEAREAGDRNAPLQDCLSPASRAPLLCLRPQGSAKPAPPWATLFRPRCGLKSRAALPFRTEEWRSREPEWRSREPEWRSREPERQSREPERQSREPFTVGRYKEPTNECSCRP